MNSIIHGDAIEKLIELPPRSVHCCVFSPPYYKLRDYDKAGQIGFEETPGEYVHSLLKIGAGIAHALRDDGTCWCVIGDSFAGGGHGSRDSKRWPKQSRNDNSPYRIKKGGRPKELIGIPWMFAFAMRHAGWMIRQEIIWSKSINGPVYRGGSCMPESLSDHGVCPECGAPWSRSTRKTKKPDRPGRVQGRKGDSLNASHGKDGRSGNHYIVQTSTIGWKPGCTHNLTPIPATVLDPMCGSGTTGVVCKRLGRSFIGIELNEQYIKTAEWRIEHNFD